MVNNG
jgi:SWI/SNF related-matrix-associated actin-dependent regulator of chromatin subfamily C